MINAHVDQDTSSSQCDVTVQEQQYNTVMYQVTEVAQRAAFARGPSRALALCCSMSKLTHPAPAHRCRDFKICAIIYNSAECAHCTQNRQDIREGGRVRMLLWCSWCVLMVQCILPLLCQSQVASELAHSCTGVLSLLGKPPPHEPCLRMYAICDSM